MEIIIAVLCLVAGLGVGYFLRHHFAQLELKDRREKGDQIIKGAKEQAGEIKYRARKESKDIIREERKNLEMEMGHREKNLKRQERDLAQSEVRLENEREGLKKESQNLKQQEAKLEEEFEKIAREIQSIKKQRSELTDKLSQVAQMTQDQAKAELVSQMEEAARVDFAKMVRKIEEETKENAESKAKRLIGIAIQRFAGEYVAEKTISTVDLPNDELKGRLIGREGRNIRAFEQICGVDLIIDDTPELVVVSSFNVVRREIARRTIEKLIADGRIHPAKIEEFHDKSKSELEKELLDLPKSADGNRHPRDSSRNSQTGGSAQLAHFLHPKPIPTRP